MERIRGKSLKKWKEYSDKDKSNIPVRTLKYITCLEERIKQLKLCGVINWVATKDQTPLNKQEVIIDTGKYGLYICTYPCPLWDDLKPTYWADIKDIKRSCL